MRYLITVKQMNGNWEPAGNPTSDAIIKTKSEAKKAVKDLSSDWEIPKSDFIITPVETPAELIAELNLIGFDGYGESEFGKYFK